MGSTLTIILVGTILGTVQLAVGIVIGRCFPFGRGRSESLDADELCKLARRVYELVTSVAGDVGEHQTRIDQVSKELTSIQASDESPLTEVFLNTVARAMQINERLQNRLSAAEVKLQQQARQIESHISEARTDPLTGLPNRRAFDDELARRIAEWGRKRTRFCLMMIDVDRFKLLNDRHGHPMGDHVLCDLAAVLENTLREMDVVTRFGGEEFAAILPDTNSADGKRITERVRTTVAATGFQFEQVEIHMTVSLGLAEVRASDDPASLIKRADEALYASKRAGRDCGHFHTGQTCQRILFDAPPNPNESCDGVVTDGDDSELELVCEDLRSRLAEVTDDQ